MLLDDLIKEYFSTTLGACLFKRWYQSSLRHQILVWLLAINFLVLLLMLVGTLVISQGIIEKNIVNQLEREQVIESELVEAYLNRQIGELAVLGGLPNILNALISPTQAPALLDRVLKRHPLVVENQNSFELVNHKLERIYSVGNSELWTPQSQILVRSALDEQTSRAAIVKEGGNYNLQVAQPIGSTGVLLLDQSLDQLMAQFFQGRHDAGAWELADASGKVIASSSISQTDTNLNIIGGIDRKSGGDHSSDTQSNLHKPAWRTIKGSLRLLPPLDVLHLELILHERSDWTSIIGLELVVPFVAVLLLICFLAFAVIALVGRSLATPLEQLTGYALAVRQTGLVDSTDALGLVKLTKRYDEVGRLSEQFSLMLERLRAGYLGLEYQVAKRSAQLETIFVLSPDGFVERNESGEISFVNPAFESLTGIKANEILHQPFNSFLQKLFPHVKSLAYSQLENIFQVDEQIRYLQLQLPFARTLAVLVKPNQHNGAIIYLRDISQEAELEEMRSAFMSTAAHELRTPISSILGYAQLLLRRLKSDAKPSAQTVQEMAAVIERQSKNMANLVNDLLDLSRLEHQIAKGFDLYETSLAGYLRPIISHFQMPGDVRSIVMHVDDHLPDVRLHPESFKRLIVNLLSNAYKYSPAGSPIKIHTFIKRLEDQEYVGIAIEDFGYGISEEDLEHVFERFYRSASIEEISGTGLGLSIAKEIMQAHGGSIDIQSSLGVGTTVTLLFPIVRARSPRISA